jgi:lauroyl/myristoyl acyltransferase
MGTADALARAAERVLPALPPAWHGPVAEAAGSLAYALAPGARRAVRANLAVVAAERADLATLPRRVFVSQVRGYLEVFHIPRLDTERLIASVSMDGWERFVRAHALGKGVIFASAHLGPIALVGQILLARGYPLTLPIEPAQSPIMRAVNRARGAQGLHLVPIDSAFGLHRALRRGGVLGFLAERAVSGVGVRVEFFGRPTLLPSAHVVLAMRTGAALIPAFAWREGNTLAVRIEEPLALPATGDREADVREGVQRFARILEAYVRRFPDQWTVFEPFWGAS